MSDVINGMKKVPRATLNKAIKGQNISLTQLAKYTSVDVDILTQEIKGQTGADIGVHADSTIPMDTVAVLFTNWGKSLQDGLGYHVMNKQLGEIK